MSLLIKGVQIVDGTGREPYKADVLIQKNIISSIGDLKGRRADRVIEGLGNYLTPGFVDVHARADHYLSVLLNPEQEGFVAQGVTTIIGGQRGVSLAPLTYGTLGPIEEWTDPTYINVDWHSVKELLARIERFHPGINFATLAGHTTVRTDIVGSRKTVQSKEIEVMKKILLEAVSQGALGISSGLGFGEGSLISAKEAAAVGMAVGDGVHVIGLRDSRGALGKSLDEALRIASETKAKTVIDNLKPFKGTGQDFKEAVDRIKQVGGEKMKFIAYVNPISENHLHAYLPASLRGGKADEVIARLRQSKNKKLIEKTWREQKTDFRSITVASAPGHHFLVGKSVVDIANNWDIDYIQAMFRLMEISRMRATVFHEDLNISSVRTAIAEEAALITSNDSGVLGGGGHAVNETARGTFPAYLRLAAREGVMSLEDAVRKVTSVPAEFFGIPDRGVIEEGRVADLVLLSKSSYEVKEVILAGKLFGEERLSGEVIRRRRY